jgi:hypothetical protein
MQEDVDMSKSSGGLSPDKPMPFPKGKQDREDEGSERESQEKPKKPSR